MLLNEVITIMKTLLNKDLQEVINLLKYKNINYAYNIASYICNEDGGDDCCAILSNRRYDKYNYSYIYLVVIEKEIVECKLYQVNKDKIYVVTTLKKYERDHMSLKDIYDFIVPL
jgi:hypothetical protein